MLQPLRRSDWFIAIALAAVVVLGAGARLVPGVTGIFHDDGIYVATSMALATGDGYRLVDLPGSPRQTKYPILYPALLAGVWLIWPEFPDNVTAMQWMSVVAAATFLGLSYLYLVRFGYSERTLAVVVVLLCATAPLVLYVSTLVLSEMVFALLFLSALWRLEGELQGTGHGRAGQVATGVILGLPFLCRSIGLTLIVASVLLLASRRRSPIWVVLGASLVAAPWLAWTQVAWGFSQPAVEAYYTNYFASLQLTTTQFIRVVATNSWFVLLDIFGITLSAGAKLALGSPALAWLGFVAFGSAAVIGAARLLFARRLLGWALASYLLAVVAWPWPPWRFLVPVLPVLATCAMLSLNAPRRASTRLLRAMIVLIAIAASAVNLYDTVAQARENRRLHYPYAASRPGAVAWSHFEDSFAWIRTNTDRHDILAAGLDSMVFLYTGRQSIRAFEHQPGALFYGLDIPATVTVKEWLQMLNTSKVSYMMLTPMPGFSEERPLAELVLAARREYPEALEPVYIGQDPRFVVFRFHPVQ